MIRSRRLPSVVSSALLLVSCVALAGARTIDVGGAAVATRTVDGVEYVPLHEFVVALHGRYWQVGDGFVVLLPGDPGEPGTEYVLRPDSTAVLSSEGRITLPTPPRLDGQRLLLSVAGLAGIVPKLPTPILYGIETSRIGDTVAVIMRTRRQSKADSVVAYGEAKSSLEYRLVVGARRDSSFVEQAALLSMVGTGPLKCISAESGTGTALRFAFVQPAVQRLSVSGDVIELRCWAKPLRRITRIVLDPGHGGEDPGALGRHETREEGLALDVSERLRAKLAARGFQVVLTRETDQAVSLFERSQRAAREAAELFVSIHVNASPNRNACGLETYFLSEAKTDWERAVAARENASFAVNNGETGNGAHDDLGLILADLAQNEFLFESSELAAKIQDATVPHAKIRDRGVRQANFYVLRNVFMPSVLVECGFITNKSEEKLLTKKNLRDRLAEGIARGIEAFARQYEGKNGVKSSAGSGNGRASRGGGRR